jgi:hypothetical protein
LRGFERFTSGTTGRTSANRARCPGWPPSPPTRSPATTARPWRSWRWRRRAAPLTDGAALAERCARLQAALGAAGLAAERLTGSALLDLVGRLGRSGGAARASVALDEEGRAGDGA